jgi:hypothetical protein
MTTAENLYRYTLYCEDEAKYINTVLKSTGTPTAPTACPNDVAHTVSPYSVIYKGMSYADKIGLDENDEDYGHNNFKYNSIDFDVSANGINTIIHNFNYDICLYSAQFTSYAEHEGDNFKMIVSPDTNLGNPLSSIDPSDNFISLHPLVLRAVYPGYCISIKEGNTDNDMGEIISIDWINGKIITSKSAVNTFTTAAYIYLDVLYCDLTFNRGHTFEIGGSNIGGSRLDYGKSIKLIYTNNSEGVKKLRFYLEYTY